MDKDGDKKGGDKKGGQSGAGLGGAAGVPDPASLLDAASLFAYWGRDQSAMAAAAASNPLFGSQFGMPGGLGGLMPNAAAAAAASGNGSDRFQMSHSHPNTMAVAASQAASLAGLHSSWWSMAQLAAQDYFARLQASGMSQMAFPHGADLAGAFPAGLGLGAMGGAGGASGGAATGGGGGGANGKGGGGGKGKKRDRSSNSSSSNASSTGGAGGMNAASYKNSSSPSVSQAAAAAAYKQSLYSQATLHKELMAITAAAAAAQNQQQQGGGGTGGGGGGGGGGNQSGSSKSKSSASSHGGGNSGSGGGGRGAAGGNTGNDILSLSRGSSASPSVNSSNKSQPSPSVTISASNMSGSSPGGHLQNLSRSGKDSGKSGSGGPAADLGLSASMNALNTLSQFGNLDLSTQQNVTATMNALAASSTKAKDYMSSGILNDPSSLLGVRLPPDTEIIKYTSSIGGSKAPGSTGRGRKKTVSIDENSYFAQMHGLSAAKRARMDTNDFGQQGGQGGTSGGGGGGGGISSGIGNSGGIGGSGNSLQGSCGGGGSGASNSGGNIGGNNDRIEVIKLPPTITSNGVYNSGKGKDSMSDSLSDWAGLNLSAKSSSTIASSLAAAAAAHAAAAVNDSQDDAPLNLSMKSSKPSDNRESPAPPSGSSTPSANSLQSLSTITAALGASSSSGNADTPRSRRKSNNKNRSSSSAAAAAAAAADAAACGSTLTAGTGFGGSASSGSANSSLNSSISSLLLAASGGGGGSGTTTSGNGNQQLVGGSAATGGTSGGGGGSSAGTSGPNSHLAAQLGLNSSLSELLKISNYDEYDYTTLAGSQFKEGRPRNLGRGVSKPKKNTVASLLAQSRAVGSKPLTAQQLLTQEADIEKLRQVMIEASQSMDSTSNTNTDTESVAESGMSESEGEEQVNVKELRVPLEKGWRRETVIRGLTKNGQIKGDVFYYPPQSLNKMKGMNQVQLYLDQFKPKDLTRDNFSFSAKAVVGTFLQPAPPPYATDGEYIKMTDAEVARRLEELKMFTRHTALGVEQRIEIAKQQQAMRDAKKLAKDEINKNKEKARQVKEAERNERLEQQRKERELKSQQAMEAKRKRDEEIARQKAEEAARKQQEKELKRQQAILQKEQERERRRQHMAIIKQLEMRRKFEDKEKKKHQVILDKLIQREKKLAMRKRDTSILQELRKPQEDSEIGDQTELPSLQRIPGLKLTATGFADLLMVFEFLHNFGETLGFSESTADMESLPSLQSLHSALTCENAIEAEEEMLSVMTHLLVCAIEDPGIPNPGRHTTLLGQTLRQADITHSNVSEILRIYLYAVGTGEVKQQSGINLERERERHHLPTEEDIKTASDKNRQFYELLSENVRYKLSELLKDKPFVALNPSTKVQILAMLCNDLLLNKAVCKQIEGSLETQAQLKKERYLLDNKIRKYKMLVARKQRIEQYEKAQAAALEKSLSMKAAEEAKRVEEAAAAAAAEDGGNKLLTICVDSTDDSGSVWVSANTTSNPGEQQGEEKTEGGEAENTDYGVLASAAGEGVNPVLENEHNHKDDTSINSSQEIVSLNNGTGATAMEESPIKVPPTLTPDDSVTIKPKEMSFTEIGEIPNMNAVSQHHPPAAGDMENPFSKSMMNDVPCDRNDDDNSDLESEGTQLEEDEDAQLTAEEAQKKYDKILEASYQNKQQLENALNQLRVKCFGQDRYWRRYWNLSKCGGIYVESVESTQPDVYKYENALEEAHASHAATAADAASVAAAAAAAEATSAVAAQATATEEAAANAESSDEEMPQEDDMPRFIPTIADIVKRDRDKNKENKDSNEYSHLIGLEERKRKRAGRSKKKHDFYNQESANDSESQDVHDEDNSRTSFSNCGEEARTDSQSEADAPPVPPLPPPMAAPLEDLQRPQTTQQNLVQEPPVPVPIQLGAKKKRDDDHLMDIEDSIPTAILVQKGNNHDETKIVEVNNQIGGINLSRPQDDGDVQLVQEETPTITIPDDDTESGDANRHQLMTNVDCLDQTAAAAVSQMTTNGGNNCDIKPKLENGDIGSGGESGEDGGKALYASDFEMGGIKEEKIKSEFKHEASDHLMERWFSIVAKDLPLSSMECPLPSIKGSTPASIARQVYTNISCKEICQIQGNRWDIGNNIQFFSVPLEKSVEIHFNNESFLTLSGLDEDEMNKVIAKKMKIESPDQLAVDVKPLPKAKRDTTDECQGELKQDIKPEAESESEFGSFSLPAYMTLTLSNLTAYVQCDQFQPLQMTPEEAKQLEEIKLHGSLKKSEIKPIPNDLRHGWWKINDIEELNDLIKSLNPRGVRERNLRQQLLESLSESVNLTTPYPVCHPRTPVPPGIGWIESVPWNAWNPAIARRVEVALLDQIEAVEDKVASASMQIKGWQIPQREGDSDNGIVEDVTIDMLRERIAGLEAAIERRYLKPPLGINTTEAQMAVIAQQEAQHNHHSSLTANTSNCSNSSEDENIPKGLMCWRDAVERSVTTAQLSMALYVLESCVAWDKSIMKANCQFCQSGEQEDKLLLCDGCDRGYHTYCFKPRMDKIPDGDWYCFECKNKATGDRKCIVCGGQRPPPLGKMVFCELCPRAYHQDCYIPPMLKYPRGKWYCQNCISKAPPKKKPQRKPKEKQNHNSSSSSQQLNQSNLSNQSLNSSHEEILPPMSSHVVPLGGTPILSSNPNAVNTCTTPLSPAHSVASTTHEELSSLGPTGAIAVTQCSTPVQPDVSQHQQAIVYAPQQYSNLEGTPVSNVLNSFQLPPPVANSFDPQQQQQQYQQYYQNQQQQHQPPQHQQQQQQQQYYQPQISEYNVLAQHQHHQQQQHHMQPQQQQQQQPQQIPESHLYSMASSSAMVMNTSQPNDANSSSMENNSLNMSITSNDGYHYDGHQMPQHQPHQQQQQHLQQPCQDNSGVVSGGSSMTTSTPTSGSGSTGYYSPSSANACASGSGYDSEKHGESSEEQSQSLTASGSHKSEKKERKERDEARELAKKEKKATKKLMKELAPCKTVLEEMEVHEDSWPFLLPVNTKQFPTYRKIIKFPMDLSTIKKRLLDMVYKSRDDFIADVRQIFDNCEVFNEDDSPVGTAGHGMRKYFERRWAELTEKHSS
ncbi:uncharacterized protein LOC129778600 isoform X3 [Toxorhynchites rutilus septentrionalis]|uniref:uncharacterized protein LOC129778600 isoform X3 n=1 Tax=Toxorhynchites rutilus septentrionalis TaxID=329112 RepID=UPI00247A16BC|nr:uncharacterized protein LOC129778600 isoform X3 [Toxorhynchites rutilus septentrionalis]